LPGSKVSISGLTVTDGIATGGAGSRMRASSPWPTAPSPETRPRTAGAEGSSTVPSAR
jgi:hypothetical protein